MSSSEAFVQFKNVQKSYDGETLVVKNLNLDIQEGEFLTMLGPSGSGKTTCLLMLAGFETAPMEKSFSTVSRSTMCLRINGTSAWFSRITPFSPT